MVMKASLQLKMGQSLTMTPQLQQAIRLLQLSTLDLQQEIQQALESNPMLETSEDDDHTDPSENENRDRENPADSESSKEEQAADLTATDWDESETAPDWASENQIPDNIPEDLPVDTAWEDIYQSAPASSSRGDDENESDFETRNSPAETLQDHLEWQLNLTPLSDRDRAIAHALLDAVDMRGYLTSPIEDIHSGLLDESEDDPLELDEVEADRKSTRLNSSHVRISYAVFCLENKKNYPT